MFFFRACADPVHCATRLPEGWALTVVGFVLVGLTALGGWLLLPSLIVQTGEFLASLPDLVSQLEAALIAVPWDALQETSSLAAIMPSSSALRVPVWQKSTTGSPPTLSCTTFSLESTLKG